MITFARQIESNSDKAMRSHCAEYSRESKYIHHILIDDTYVFSFAFKFKFVGLFFDDRKPRRLDALAI